MTGKDWATWGPVMGLGIAMIAIAFRAWIGSRPRPLNLGLMWIIPALLGALLVALLSISGLSGLDWLWVALALAAGSALGWQRGRFMQITLDPETGKPMAKNSPAALILILVLLLVRFGLRESIPPSIGLGQMLISDLFLAFAVGLLASQRVEMFIRARRLIGGAAPAEQLAG
ncbi:MAG: CcdC protein domain-containing protein [Caulobacter sp.]